MWGPAMRLVHFPVSSLACATAVKYLLAPRAGAQCCLFTLTLRAIARMREKMRMRARALARARASMRVNEGEGEGKDEGGVRVYHGARHPVPLVHSSHTGHDCRRTVHTQCARPLRLPSLLAGSHARCCLVLRPREHLLAVGRCRMTRLPGDRGGTFHRVLDRY